MKTLIYLNNRIILITIGLFLIPVFEISAQNNASCNISFHSELKGQQSTSNGKIEIKIVAKGDGKLHINKNGDIYGKGHVSVIQNTDISNPSVSYRPHHGSGEVSFKGEVRGNLLHFNIEPGKIMCKGKIVFYTPKGKEIKSNEEPFNPSYITSGNNTIQYEQGSVSNSEVKGSFFKGASHFSLSQLTEPPVKITSKGQSQDYHPTPWNLSMKMKIKNRISSPQASGQTDMEINGNVDFKMPVDEGSVQSKGPMKFRSHSKWNSPIARQSSTSGSGKLYLDGEVKKDTLIFVPHSTIEESKVNQGGKQYSSRMNTGTNLFNTNEQVKIPAKNNAIIGDTFIMNQGPMKSTTISTWELKGKKTEIWEVIVKGANTHYNGGSKVAGGLRVYWKIKSKIIIENDKYKKGEGDASIEKIGPHSHPPAVYQCHSIHKSVKSSSGYSVYTPHVDNPHLNIQGKKSGIKVNLKLYSPKYNKNHTAYYVACECKLNKQEAAKKVVNWDITGSDTRKKFNAKYIYPFPPYVEILLKDGWTKSMGNKNSMNYEKIVVRRIQ
jgi:hypothetical protein